MKRTALIHIEQPSGVLLGDLRIQTLSVDTQIGNLAPYIKGREGIETILRYPGILRDRQPIELNGFKSADIMRRASSIQEEIMSGGMYKGFSDPYSGIAARHPILVSYPADAIWFARERAMDAWESSLERVLPNAGLGLDQAAAKKVAAKARLLAANSAKTYGYWRGSLATRVAGSPGRENGLPLSMVILYWALQNAIDARAKWFAGLVPLIHSSTPGSTLASHTFNEAFASVVAGRLKAALPTPAYMYTLNLDSTLFSEAKWNAMLRNVVGNTRLILQDEQYENAIDGVHVSIRNLDAISLSVERVRTVRKLMEKLSDICLEFKVPLWCSRFGPVSFAALDEGGTVASFMPNTNTGDVFTEGGPGDRDRFFGKVFNPGTRSRWNINEVRAAMNGPDRGMPSFSGAWTKNAPTREELLNDKRYRVHFSGPYTIAAMNGCLDQWRFDVSSGETKPGRSFLEGGEATYQSWGSPD